MYEPQKPQLCHIEESACLFAPNSVALRGLSWDFSLVLLRAQEALNLKIVAARVKKECYSKDVRGPRDHRERRMVYHTGGTIKSDLEHRKHEFVDQACKIYSPPKI